MTADHDDLAAILAKHAMNRTYRDMTVRCWGCDWTAPYGLGVDSDVIHRAHMAQMVLESNWLRRMRAKELRKAADDLRPKASVKNVLKARLAPMRMAAIWDCAEWLSDRADRVDAEDGEN